MDSFIISKISIHFILPTISMESNQNKRAQPDSEAMEEEDHHSDQRQDTEEHQEQEEVSTHDDRTEEEERTEQIKERTVYARNILDAITPAQQKLFK